MPNYGADCAIRGRLTSWALYSLSHPLSTWYGLSDSSTPGQVNNEPARTPVCPHTSSPPSIIACPGGPQFGPARWIRLRGLRYGAKWTALGRCSVAMSTIPTSITQLHRGRVSDPRRVSTPPQSARAVIGQRVSRSIWL